ncbi:hypothetical protein RRG08_032129 [Elysia crispata]|uniref:Uncharacterized protein n=1 Tax=Elysia crispata TaxID=231223 RepID=A0AAE0ZDI7_9GAST|nr:hypothetical protein RRG08_032129 [Elysia crispata]
MEESAEGQSFCSFRTANSATALHVSREEVILGYWVNDFSKDQLFSTISTKFTHRLPAVTNLPATIPPQPAPRSNLKRNTRVSPLVVI